MGSSITRRSWNDPGLHEVVGDSYRLYLQDTSILQQKHVVALTKDSNEIQRLLRRNRDILPNNDEMGDY